MRIFLLLAFLHMTILAKTQSVDIEDPYFYLTLIEMGVDLNGDAVIQTSEAEQVTTLNLSDREIKSLVGINGFTNLEDLDASENDFRESDVEINGLAKLKVLNLERSSIENIELSGLLQLEVLELSYNRLVSLDISGLPNVISVTASACQLQSFSVSQLQHLETLNLETNRNMETCLLYTSPSPRDRTRSRMPSSA